MLKLILALLPLAASVTGQQPSSQADKNAPRAAASKTAASTIQGIPAGAVKIDENTYRFEEKNASGKPGKVWLFRRNPFGVSKVEEKDAALNGTALPPPETPTKAIDLGDSYRFERSGPFGNKVWTRKKTELTAEEQGIVSKGAGASLSSASHSAIQKVTN